MDILFSEDARAIRRDGFQPTDADIFCTDTSGVHEGPFRSDKSLFCCCTSGSIGGIILP